jgi:hypothetical protein
LTTKQSATILPLGLRNNEYIPHLLRGVGGSRRAIVLVVSPWRNFEVSRPLIYRIERVESRAMEDPLSDCGRNRERVMVKWGVYWDTNLIYNLLA